MSSQKIVRTVNEVTAAARAMLRQAVCPECAKKGYEDSEECAWCDERVEFTATELLRDFESERAAQPSSNELLACPFCGDRFRAEVQADGVQCGNCGCVGPAFHSLAGDPVASWNRRAAVEPCAGWRAWAQHLEQCTDCHVGDMCDEGRALKAVENGADSPKAPWLTTAHLLCTDAGIPQGHINDRLLALRQKLERPAPPPCAVWHPIETAPKDGTVIDLWIDGNRWSDVRWGLPNHSCGEDGHYCDSEWHSLDEGWVCTALNHALSDMAPTHWMPLPSSPLTKEGAQ